MNTAGSRTNFGVALFVSITICFAPVFGNAQSARPNQAQESAAELQVRQRVNELLKQMTPEEKIGQLSQLFVFGASAAVETRIRNGEVGSVLFVTDPVQINRIQRIAVDGSRLHIPLLFGLDVIHGLRTIFPVPIGMAASWDPKMVEEAQATAAREARSSGIHWTFAPMVDIARDPRWGRIVEGAGEDPYLGSAMARAQVRGFQGEFVGAPEHIVACAKHFAGYGAAEGGRDYDAAEISDSQLMNVYLPPFHTAVEAGVGTIMSAYMDLNGVPATGNKWLLRDVLRDQWQFRGFVVSDADAVKSLKTHGFAMDENGAATRAFSAGVNMEMAIGKTAYSESLPQALKDGRITVAQLDETVRPILETKIRLGLFETPYVDEAKAKQVLQTPSHREEARHAAERSAVLLRNEGGLLPIRSAKYKRVAVLGPLADSKVDVVGSWVFANNVEETVSVLAGLKDNAPPGTQFEYAPGVQMSRKFPSPFAVFGGKKPAAWTENQAKQEFAKAVQLAQSSDLAIVVLGENQDMSGEAASRSSLDFPGNQQQLLEAVVATGKPVVLILLNGRPLNIAWAAEHVPAILEAWYPGTQGGNAVADLMFGKAVPGGKLPFTWPRNAGQVPIFYSHYTTHAPGNQGKRYWNEESTPLFPFGFGLSYSTFEFSNLQVKSMQVKGGQPVVVTVDVANNSDSSGDEVVQLYVHQQSGTSSRPVRELKGFSRLSISAHDKKTVQFTLSEDDLSYWSAATKSWVRDAAVFDVWVGGDSNAALKGSFSVAQ